MLDVYFKMYEIEFVLFWGDNGHDHTQFTLYYMFSWSRGVMGNRLD